MKIVGITSCSTGIAHTYMAAENLEIAAKKRNIEIKVETQGSIGAENVLTPQEIADADAVIIAASTLMLLKRLIIQMSCLTEHRMRLFTRLTRRLSRKQNQKKAGSIVI